MIKRTGCDSFGGCSESIFEIGFSTDTRHCRADAVQASGVVPNLDLCKGATSSPVITGERVDDGKVQMIPWAANSVVEMGDMT